MIRRFFFGCAIFIALLLAVLATGLYPVALVDGTPILFRTWKNAERAAMQFANARLKTAGQQAINFYAPENKELLEEVGRNTLSFLIENKILSQEGKKISDDFYAAAEQKVADALKGKNVEQGTKAVYGLDLEQLKKMVLIPQAWRDVLQETLSVKKQTAEEWLKDVKQSKKIRLLFIPFYWNGERVE